MGHMPAKSNILTEARRSRRSMFKAFGVVFGAVVASSVAGKAASAEDRRECFLRGTHIRTSRGYRPIETLSEGDLLPTCFGGEAPIVRLDSFVVPRGGGMRPVRVARSALDDNVPAADLRLTGPHAIYIDGILISIVNLVNGTTIAFDDDTSDEELEFFHIELARHDVIDAEGAACESLLTPSMIPCAPRLALDGGRSELQSRLRSAAAIFADRRTAFDIVRDKLEERSVFVPVRAHSDIHV